MKTSKASVLTASFTLLVYTLLKLTHFSRVRSVYVCACLHVFVKCQQRFHALGVCVRACVCVRTCVCDRKQLFAGLLHHQQKRRFMRESCVNVCAANRRNKHRLRGFVWPACLWQSCVNKC